MAKSGAVWGIDIGQCALKALKCRPGDDKTKVTAEAFDYIEYPKILSQPEADPVELVREALQTFLSRNSVRGDRVAVSVSGQSGLARFIKLPPVESRRIPDIVKYEARQQIPFALEDVVWDYQRMAGGSEDEGFALETEVGLFAMKRDQVFRALRPFDEAQIEVDIIQLTPLAIYNFTVFDQMRDLPPADEYDPDNPPESVVVLSLGTDTTDLVVTNGFRVWQRSVPIGGSHFTKALTKELRLTFAKAEHLKRNAMQAEDQKAVFQAMRPVFNDLLTEIQRSIGYFTGIDRNAKIGRVVALGNAMKLPGLQKYLSQNLGYPVAEIESYKGMGGGSVVTSPAFKENLLSFAVCYGLTLQGLNNSKLSTNLLPKEIVTDRLIRDKKPWAVAVAAVILLGCAINFLAHWRAWNSVKEEKFSREFAQSDQISNTASQHKADFETANSTYKTVDTVGQNIVGNVDGRLMWLEVMKAIDASLPHEIEGQPVPKDLTQQRELHITEMECEKFGNLADWFAGVGKKYQEGKSGSPPPEGSPEQPPADPSAAPPADPNDPNAIAQAATPAGGPTGEGWVIQLTGYHFHNTQRESQGAKYVRDTLLRKLEEGTVQLPKKGEPGVMESVAIKDLGISHPVLVISPRIDDVELVDPNAEPTEAPPPLPGQPATAAQPPKLIKVPRFDFIVQFAWQETPQSKRLEKKAKAAAEPAGEAPAGEAPAGNTAQAGTGGN